MSFLDKFKKEQKKPVSSPKKEKLLKEKKIDKKPIDKKPEEKKIKAKKPITRAYQVLKEPHITEKATDLSKENKYVFKVYSGANKIEIKKAIENLYGIDVLAVRIITVHPKKRRLGRTEGWRKGYKKAIVKVKKGQKIEVLPR